MDCDLSDHSYVLTVIKNRMERESRILSKTWVNYGALNLAYRSFLEELQSNPLPADECLKAITTRYNQLTKEHSRTTTVQVKVKHNCCPWYNFDIWKLGNVRDRVLKTWKQNRQDQHLHDLLVHANRRLNAAKTKAKASYHSRLFYTSNPKLLWSRINELLGGKSKSATSLTLNVDQKQEDDPETVANLFNNYFSSVGDNLGSQLTSDGDINKFRTIKTSTMSLFLRPASPQEVQNLISTLDSNKATGYDGFPISALKFHRGQLSTLISHCFNECVSSGEYPTCLKKAIVYPVFKGGDPSVLSNYRPISVLPAINKVFEKLLYARIYDFLSCTHQLYHYQFGFRTGSSTEGAVLEFIDEISASLDQKLSAGAIFLDLSKAFDTINHSMLLKKLDACGIRGLPNTLLSNYLTDRTQQVAVSGIRSMNELINCGVPQGSVLGPLLFLIYVNDLPNLPLEGKPRLFADDTAISYAYSSPVDVVAHMEKDMKQVIDYLENNLLALNVSKTKMMMFRFSKSILPEYPTLAVRGQPIEEVANFKYLGVHVDNRLSWDVHVREVVGKCSSLCGILRKLSRSVPNHVLLKMYHAFIQSRYQYAIAAWGSCSKVHLKEVQVQQNRCIKAIYKLPFLHPTNDLYTMSQHKILPISGLYTQRTAMVMYKILNNVNTHHNWIFRTTLHDRNTRRAHHIRRQAFRTELGRKRFQVNGPNVYTVYQKI